MGRWLLLYRPESFDGLVIQLVYYITAFAALDSAVLVVVDFGDLDSAVPALLALLVVILLCSGCALCTQHFSQNEASRQRNSAWDNQKSK